MTILPSAENGLSFGCSSFSLLGHSFLLGRTLDNPFLNFNDTCDRHFGFCSGCFQTQRPTRSVFFPNLWSGAYIHRIRMLISILSPFLECLSEAGETIAPKTPLRWQSHYRQILRTQSIHFMSFFLIAYSSIELTIASEWFWLPWKLSWIKLLFGSLDGKFYEECSWRGCIF